LSFPFARFRARSHSPRAAVRRLAISRFISAAGSDATGVAIGFALYAQTGSAAWLSLSLVLTVGASALVSPLAGRAGDLLDRRRLMIGAELAAATVMVALALVHSPVALVALGLLLSAIATLFGPAAGAAIAYVAGERHMTWASSAMATGGNVGRTAGRFGAGALIAAFGAGSVFVLDALTFLLSAWIIASIRHAFSAPLTAPVPDEAPPVPAKTGGFRVLADTRTARLLVMSACMSTFATAFSMTAEVPLVFEIGAGAFGLGALTACWGGGMIAGSWYAGRALHRGNEATGVLAGRLAMATGVGLVAVAPSLGPMLACYLLGGAGGGFMGVATQSLLMRSVPDQARARLIGAVESCRNVAFGAGVIGAGAAVTVTGARPVYAVVGLGMALAALPVAALIASLGGPRRLRPAPA
jgi:DHA3 family macrolide efflux protein-like MFS transporter